VEADEVVPPPDSSSSSVYSLAVGPDGRRYTDAERQARWDAFRRSKFFKVCIK
jgi:hypothetical protein